MSEEPQEPLPLAGLRVIDVGTRIGAPFCAGLLGEMGAEVIKVEDPRGGDFMRTIGPFVEEGTPEAGETAGSGDAGAGGTGGVGETGRGAGYSLWWSVEGRGRKGVTLNLRRPKGQALFRRLVERADVVCENFRPGTLEAWNIGPGDCDPRLVWARISVFGQDGPNAGRPGIGPHGHRLRRAAQPDRLSRPPTGPSRRDHFGLPHRRVRGGGRRSPPCIAATVPIRARGVVGVVDAPLYGSILRILEWTIAGQDRIGLTRRREGNRLPNSAPLDNYLTADGRYVCIVAGSDANFSRLCAAMDRPTCWATPAGPRSPSGRPMPTRSTRSLPMGRRLTAAEVEAQCIEHGVPVGTIYDANDILADPHMRERGLVTVDDPVAGPLLQQAPFPRLDGRVPRAPAPAPLLGQHNHEVWAIWSG